MFGTGTKGVDHGIPRYTGEAGRAAACFGKLLYR